MDVSGRYLVNTSDLDEASGMLAATYGQMRISATAQTSAHPWIRIWRTRVGPMTLDDAEITADIHYEMEAPQCVLLCRIRAGSLDLRIGDQVTSFGRGELIAVVADGASMEGVARHTRCDLVTFDRRLWGEVTAERGDHRFGNPLKRFSSPVNPSAGQQVADVIDHIRRFVANNPLVAREPLVAGSAARYLAATMLTAFPSAGFTI
ncbi:hypothetical protein [Mycolicibacterium gilvum]|uniref:hypothetical protein n=1 Tax=Mycolicibacterium gilvum TaxID=1804 RepID=UPI00404670A5